MRAVVLERQGEPLKPTTLPDPEPRAGPAAAERSAPARCAAPTCTCATTRSRRPSSRSCSATRSSAAPRTAGASASRGSAGPTATCRYCTTDRENLCVNARFTGRDIDGGFAELTVADERYCLPLPDELVRRAGRAAAVRRADRLPRAEVHRRRHRLGLYGFGSAAHMICQVAVYQGREVFAFTRPSDEAHPGVRDVARRHLGGRQRRDARPSRSTPRSSSPPPASSSPRR